MPIQNASDSQKVDYLWKKIVYGAAKTDIAGNIDATQEPVASPLQIRADKILQDSASIPAVIPGSNSSVVTVYPTTFPVECISTAGIPTPTLTWQTGRTFWVPPEFGSTYQVKVYIAPSGNAANVASKGTQVFATGSGSNDLWVFDYQSGILNFNSNNTPYNGASPISFTGNSVYISGAVYAGQFGLPTISNIALGVVSNITFSNTTISTAFTNGNIYFSPTGTGTVQFTGNAAIGLPYGTDATRPTNPETGFTRYNSARSSIEYWNGSQWLAPGEAVISSQTINPDGAANIFALSSNTTTAGVLVSINGTLQQPIDSYVIVNNNQIQFTEIPLTTDTVEIRYISVGAVTVGSLQFQNTTFVTLDAANVNVTGNVLPSANVTYDLGSPTLRWRTGYFAANTLDLGGSTIGVSPNGFSFTAAGSPTPITMSANGAMTSNTLMAPTVTVMSTTPSTHSANGALVVVGGLGVGGNLNLAGNLIVGSAIYAGATSGVSGQVLQTTGTGVQWASADNILSGASNVRVTANYVNVAILSSNIGSFSSQGLVLTGNITASQGTFNGNVTIQGNLFVNGNLTTINANNLIVNDSMIYLADDNPADILDIGIVSSFTDAVRYQHTGFVRDATDGTWKLFANVVAEPTTTVDFTNANYSNLRIGSLTATVITSTGLINTTANISASTGVFGAINATGYINTTGNISAAQGNFGNAAIAGGSHTGINAIAPAGNAAVNLGSLTNQWGTIYGTATTAQYADLAENYVADHNYVPGTVVDFGGTHEITLSDTDMSTAVAGVVSSNPAYLMNSAQQGAHVIAVALQGRVQTRVTGRIRKGNMLVSAGDGTARAELFPHVGTVIGKALEDFNGQTGTIEIVVGVR